MIIGPEVQPHAEPHHKLIQQ